MEVAMKPVLPAVSLLLTLAAPALAQPAKGPAFYVVLNSLSDFIDESLAIIRG